MAQLAGFNVVWFDIDFQPHWKTLSDSYLLLPVLHMLQADVAINMAYLRLGWNAMDFKKLLIAVETQSKRGSQQLLRREQMSDDDWLRQWSKRAAEETKAKRMQKLRILLAMGAAMLTMQVLCAVFIAWDTTDELRNVALLMLVDAIFVTGGLDGDRDGIMPALIAVGAHANLSVWHPSPDHLSYMEPIFKHAIVVFLLSLRLVFLMAKGGMQQGLSHEIRLEALRGFVAFQKRPPVYGNRWTPGPRFVWILLLSLHMFFNGGMALGKIIAKISYENEYRSFGSIWCALKLQQRASALTLPLLVLGVLVIIVHSWAHGGQYRPEKLFKRTSLNVSMIVIAGLVVVLLALSWSVFPLVVRCQHNVWDSPISGIRSLTGTIFGICAGIVFWGQWRRHAFQSSVALGTLFVVAVVLIMVGSPWNMKWLTERAPTRDEAQMFVFYVMFVQAVCFFVIWRSFFGTGFKFVALAQGAAFCIPLASALFCLYLVKVPEALEIFKVGIATMPLGGKKVNQGSLVVTSTMLFSPMILFFIILKGNQLVQLTRAEDAGDEEEQDEHKIMRERCALQLVMTMGEITAGMAMVAFWCGWLFFVAALLIFLAYMMAFILQCEFLVSTRPYPVALKASWAFLYCLVGIYCISFAILRSPWFAPLIFLITTELQLANVGLSSHLRSVQGLSHGLRSTFYTYDPLKDRIIPIWGARFHPLAAAVLTGIVWSVLAAAMGILPRLNLCLATLRVCLVTLWRFHFRHLSDVPAWFVQAQPHWAMEEGIRAWGGSHVGVQSPSKLVGLLDERSVRVEKLEQELSRENAMAASEELNRAQESRRRCGLLWELRVALRVQGAVDYLASGLLALCVSLDVPVNTIDDVLCMPERQWQQIAKQWTILEQRAKSEDELQRQEMLLGQGDGPASVEGKDPELGRTTTQEVSHAYAWPQLSDSELGGVESKSGWCSELCDWWRNNDKKIMHVSECTAEEELQQLRDSWQRAKKQLARTCNGSFADPRFPAVTQSLGTAAQRAPGAVWLRPMELFRGSQCVLRPESLAESFSTSARESWRSTPKTSANHGRSSSLVANEMVRGINQGQLGDCWLLSAFCVLCTRPALLETIFLDPPGLSDCGAYCFRLYEDGMPRSVVVDDRIPANQMGPGCAQAVFARPQKAAGGEVVLWPLLLEKAFAKVNGSYGAIEAGQVHEALMDMTGGLGEIIGLRGQMGATTNADHLWAKLCHLKKSGHLLTAGSDGSSDAHMSPRGIVQGHAYSILQVRALYGGLRLLKLRNPWGQGEWKGDFGARSPRWTPELRATLRYYSEDDGILWMPMKDFLCEFACVYVCRIFKSESFERQVLQGHWTHSDKQAIPLRVESGAGVVCFQLQQSDDRKSMTGGSPIRLEIVEDHSVDDTNPATPFSRKWKQGTPVTAQRECALDVKLRAGVYKVIAQVCGPKRGKFALTVFNHRAMRVVLGSPGESCCDVPQSGDFGVTASSSQGSGQSGPSFQWSWSNPATPQVRVTAPTFWGASDHDSRVRNQQGWVEMASPRGWPGGGPHIGLPGSGGFRDTSPVSPSGGFYAPPPPLSPSGNFRATFQNLPGRGGGNGDFGL